MPQTEVIKDEKTKGGHFWLFVTLLFFSILFFLLYTSFYDNSFAKKITSNVVSDSKQSTYEIEGTLSVPEELAIDSFIKKVSLKIKESSEISIGNQIMQLSRDSSIVIDNFQGSIIINGRKISTVDGDASQFFINGMHLQSKSGSLEIQGKDFDYSYIVLDDVSFDKLSYVTTGTININKGKITIRLDGENFLLKEFQGDAEMSKNYLKLQGVSSDFNVEDFIQKPIATKKNASVG